MNESIIVGFFFTQMEVEVLGKLKKYVPTKFKAKDSYYSKEAADRAVCFIESLKHTDGVWYNKPFELLDWQEQIIRDVFGILKPNGYRQFNTAYIEIPKNKERVNLQQQSLFYLHVVILKKEPKFMVVLQIETKRRLYSMWQKRWLNLTST